MFPAFLLNINIYEFLGDYQMKLSDFLVEAINYEDMFSKLYTVLEQNNINTSSLKENVKDMIKSAKQDLKREDRIVWFMRLYKIWTLNYYKTMIDNDVVLAEIDKDLKSTAKKANINLMTDIIRTPTATLSTLSHFISLPIPEIQNYTFTNQKYQDIWVDFNNFEEEWKRESKGAIAPREGDKIVVKFNDNNAWWLLARGSCKEEAEAMGHCGNVPSERPGERILSFRTKQPNGLWKPHLTFILDKDGKIGEAKGRGNEKPTEKYHPYIAKLLSNSDLIKGIKGGGYRPENNFKLSDLSDELREKVFNANEQLKITSLSIWDKYKTYGLTDAIKDELYNISNDSRIDTVNEWSEDNKSVIVEKYNDIERFKNSINTTYGLLEKALEIFNQVNDGDVDLEDIQDRFYPKSEDYKDIIERLPDFYLNKIKKSVDYTGNDLETLSTMLDKSKYGPELRKAMIDASGSPFGKSFDKEEFLVYLNILLKLYSYSSSNSYVSIDDIQSVDDYVIVRIPTYEYIKLVYLMEFDKNNDNIEDAEEASEEDIYIYESMLRDRTWIPLSEWDLKDYTSDSTKDYLSEDEYEIFKKYKKFDIENTEVVGISQNFDIPVAVKYFTNYIDMNESTNISRLKMLAGI